MPFSSFSFQSLFTHKQIVWITSAIVCCHNKNSLLETEHYSHKILMQWSSWSKHVFERDDSHAISCAISRQEKGGLHKCIARFITYSSPWRADTWFPSLPRKECTGVRYVITKCSRMDGLPNFLTHGASPARFARRISTNIFGKGVSSSSSVLLCLHPFCIHSFYRLFGPFKWSAMP